MKLKLNYFFAFLAIMAVFTSCSKEYSYEGGYTGSSAGTSIFTFTGAGSACTNATINGTYTADTILNNSNTVILSVTVDSVGTYNISTPVNNGISFSATGTFSSTGAQTITLTGTGTPTAAGTFYFTPGGNGCAFPITVIANSTTPPVIVPPVLPPGTYTYYYVATVDGVNYVQTVSNTNNFQVISFNSSVGDDYTFASSIETIMQPVPAGTTYFNLQKGIFTNFSASTHASFKAYFAPGTYPFAQKQSNGVDGDGVIIGWGDNTSDWSTDNAPGTQTGSTFTITNVQDGTSIGNQYWINVAGTFNCNIYNANGNSKTITNGKFLIEFLYQ